MDKKVEYLFYSNAVSKISVNVDNDTLNMAISACSRATNQSIIVIDYNNHEVLYMSDNMLYLDEVEVKDYKRSSNNPYWSFVTEEVLDKMISIKDAYPSLSEQIDTTEYSHHLCVLEYPITIRGHEFFINQTSTPICLRSDGITGIGLFSFRPSTKKEMSCVIIGDSGKRWAFNFQDKQFHMYNLNVNLSKTEKEIIQRARKGMSNEEIAADMFIAENTVKTHKNRIFKKLHVKTISEALVVVSNYHLI